MDETMGSILKSTLSNTKLIVFLSVSFLFILLFLIPFVRVPGRARMERNFQRHNESIIMIKNYITEQGHDNILVWDRHAEAGVLSLGLGYDPIPVSDEDVLGAIRLLFERRRVNVIVRRGNNIIFQMWSTRNHGRGIVYSIDGSVPAPSSGLQYLTEIEPLSEEAWFFYVENVHTWRSRNRN